MTLLDPTNVVYLVGLVIPLLVGLVAKKFADGAVKGWLNAILTTVVVVIATLVGPDGGWQWQEFLKAFLETFLVSIATYYGFYKPTGIANAVQNIAPNFGVGTPKYDAKHDAPCVDCEPEANLLPVDYAFDVSSDPNVEVADNQTPISDHVED